MADVTLGDSTTAQRTLAAIRAMVQREIAQAGVNPQLATVTQIDADLGTCRVRFRSEAADVQVKMGATQPTQVGQVVRVAGPSSDLWVVDVIGTAALTGPVSASLAAPTNLKVTSVGIALSVTWFPVPFAGRYEVQFTDTTTSTTVSVQTVSTRFVIDDLIEGESYNVQVRAVSSSSSVGAWAVFGSAVIIGGFPAQSLTDGTAPSSSPQPTVTGGIGMLFVQWDPIVNQDLVTYEVYADFESGFTPDATNKLGETSGTFFTFQRLADGSPLPYDNHTFVRIIARDNDGASPAGAQGFATPLQVQSGDFGSTAISDGAVPANSPSDFNINAGIGYLFLTWAAITNADEVTYEVHMSTTQIYTPGASTLVGETKGTFIFLRERPPGFGGGPLTYETTYYIRVWAKDNDGYAPATSPIKPGTSVKAGSGDIGDGAVGTVQIATAAITTALIADLAVGEAKIQNASITTAKITDGAITNAKIGTAAIGQANIAVAAIGSAQIANAAITDAHIASLNADKIQAGTLSAIDISGVTITGSTFETAASGARIEMASGEDSGSVFYFSGHTSELFQGFITAGQGTNPFGNDAGFLTIASPKVTTQGNDAGALIELWNDSTDGAQTVRITGDLYMRGEVIGDDGSTSLFTVKSDEISFKTAGSLERFNMQPTQTSIFYSTGNRELRLEPGGDMAIYNLTTRIFTAGTGGISDARLKKNIRTIDPEANAMTAIRAMPLIEFEFSGRDIDDAYDLDLPKGVRLGLSAQDVEVVYPQAVSDEGNKLLDAHSMVALAIGGIQALDTRLDALERATGPGPKPAPEPERD